MFLLPRKPDKGEMSRAQAMALWSKWPRTGILRLAGQSAKELCISGGKPFCWASLNEVTVTTGLVSCRDFGSYATEMLQESLAPM